MGQITDVRPKAASKGSDPGRRGQSVELRRPRYMMFAMPLPEKELIDQIRIMVGKGRKDGVVAGIGDDCAVLRIAPGQEILVTTDFSLEGVHFRRDWHPADSVGHRCLARGLSDVAAMGGSPLSAFLSLALPRGLPQAWVRRFMGGLIKLAVRYGVTLAGGDTAQSTGGVLADIVVLGTVPRGKAVLRSTARVGDRIYVSGALGGSAAAVQKMRMHPGTKISARDYKRHFYPEPRVELGQALRQSGLVTAMIDTSDGLSTDLAHICEESGVGAEITAESIPQARVADLEMALHGGEDYELLFTVGARKKVPAQIAGVSLTEIGVITRGRGIFLRRGSRKERLRARGWEHFRER